MATRFTPTKSKGARLRSGDPGDAAAPTGLQSNTEYPFEHARLAAIQGLLIAADGSTLLDWFAEFGITTAPEIAFDLNYIVGGRHSTHSVQ